MSNKQKKKLLEAVLILVIAFIAVYLNPEEVKNKETVQYRETESVVKVTNGETLKVHFIDVGQADSALIECGGEYMLIDAGNNEDGPKLVSYFQSLGIKNFKFVIGTHAHEDHIGGMDDIINNFTIENFYMPDVITTTKTFEDVLDSLENNKIAFKTPKKNDKFVLSNANITTLNVESNSNNLNDTSIVLRLQYGTTSFLFTGDASSEIENKLLNNNIKSDVLKVGHHGSKYSNSLQFLKQVSPTYAIISVGKNNIYNHPHDVVINRLNNLKTKIYRTDKSGTIIAESNGTIINFETIKTNTNG